MTLAELVAEFKITGNIDKIDDIIRDLKLTENQVLKTEGAFSDFRNKTADIGTAVKGITQKVTLLTGAITIGAGAFDVWIDKSATAIDEMNDLAKTTGVSVEYLQQLRYTAQLNGGSFESVDATISQFSKNLGEFAALGTGRAAQAFEKLGINPKINGQMRSVDDVLGEVFKKLHGLSDIEQIGMAKKLGIDDKLIQMIRLNKDEMQKFQDEAIALGIITQEDADKINAYKDSMDRLGFAQNALSNRIAVQFAPALTEVADSLTDLLKTDGKEIVETIKKIGSFLNGTIGTIWNFGKAFYNVIDSTVGAQTATYALGAVIIWLNRQLIKSVGLLAMTPIGMLTIGFVALVAIIDDLIVGVQGGKSVINEFLKEWVGTDLAAIVSQWKQAWIDLMGTITNWKNSLISNVAYAIDFMVNSFNRGKETLGQFFNDIVNWGISAFNQLIDIINSTVNEINSLINPLLSLAGMEITPTVKINHIEAIQNPLANANIKNRAVSNVTGGAGIHQKNNVSINVNSTNPTVAAKMTNNGLVGALKSANAQLGRGGR